MATSIFRQIGADARFHHQLKYPGKPVSTLSLLPIFFSARGLWLVIWHRIAYYSTTRRNLRNPGWWFARGLEGVGTYLNALFSKSELMTDCELQGPVYLSDKGYFMIGAQSIGPGVIIHDHVTFGQTVASAKTGRPTVGGNVWIGPNCIIAGDLHIGEGSTLLPGTMLTYSVPPGTVVKGNPGRVVLSDHDNSALRQSLASKPDLPL